MQNNISVYSRLRKEDPMIALVIATEETLMPVSAAPSSSLPAGEGVGGSGSGTSKRRGWKRRTQPSSKIQRRTRSKTTKPTSSSNCTTYRKPDKKHPVQRSMPVCSFTDAHNTTPMSSKHGA